MKSIPNSIFYMCPVSKPEFIPLFTGFDKFYTPQVVQDVFQQ